MRVQLLSIPADFGRGANDGAYYPVGLLTLGTHLRRASPKVDVSVVDIHHQPDFRPSAEVVGISASSALNYDNVLRMAKAAKDVGATVVLGGPHATQLAEQILCRRTELVDYVIRGHGEVPLVRLLAALETGADLRSVPNLSWRAQDGTPIHNPTDTDSWRYDNFVPLDLSLLSPSVAVYSNTFRHRIDPTVQAAFPLFTHFGCGFRAMMQRRDRPGERFASWCSYCSLNDPVSTRTGSAIVQEALDLARSACLPDGSRILLKCYGDNVGTQSDMLHDLAASIAGSNSWRRYMFGWTFYAQSSRVSPRLVSLLQQVGTTNLYVGFDSADDDVQRVNGLGTSLSTHRNAVRCCRDARIRIQAGFVLGCAGETRRSVDNTVRFAEELAEQGLLERVNAAILVVMPGSPSYFRLCEREPWIAALDRLPTEELQWHWIRHFCPDLGADAADGLRILRWAANRLDDLSPGPHASMGFVSERLAAERSHSEI